MRRSSSHVHRFRAGWARLLAVGVTGALGCGDAAAPAPAAATGSTGATTTQTQTGADETGTGTETEGEPPTTATVIHSWGPQTLAPLEETVPCIQWTLDNEQALYVNAVALGNRGAYHHSNWFVVPEEAYPGEDGFFDCDERGYNELGAASQGTVLTAQSTQSRYERMELPSGVVVKIPPHHKVLGGGHLLNLANAEYETELQMSLELIHPRDVEVVVAPIRFSYVDLDIPGMTESRFVGECDLDTPHRIKTGDPLALQIYYLLPHYHYLGNYMDLTVFGGPDDGDSVFHLEGFDASDHGQAFDPPLDFAGATGVRFTCGYDNWRDDDVGWGIGDQEMCAMLGLADVAVLMDVSVTGGNQVVDVVDGIQINTGPCGTITVPKNATQGPPTAAEIEGELYVPPTDPADTGLEPLDTCYDTPADATPTLAPTLSNVRDTLLVSTCTFSSCHDAGNPAAGLDLSAADLHATLLGASSQSSLPLVSPGDPEGSWLYQVLSRCEPTDDTGQLRPHMPLGAPNLADPRFVALVRDWIAAGAADD